MRCIFDFILLSHNIHDCWKFFLSRAQSFFFLFFFLFICPDSELTAGFTYENQLTDVLQDIKHIYDKTPDKSLYIPNLSCKAGQGGG